MNAATQGQRDLAGRILVEETKGAGSAEVATAADRIWQKLSARLENVLTVQGCELLGRRALYLTQTDFPTSKGPSTTISMADLGQVLKDVSEEQAAQAAQQVYANLFHLLMTLIGEALVLRAIRDVWPDASLRDSQPVDQETRK